MIALKKYCWLLRELLACLASPLGQHQALREAVPSQRPFHFGANQTLLVCFQLFLARNTPRQLQTALLLLNADEHQVLPGDQGSSQQNRCTRLS